MSAREQYAEVLAALDKQIAYWRRARDGGQGGESKAVTGARVVTWEHAREIVAAADQLSEPEWPCADYKAPITCLTTPKPKTLLCGWCRAQPNAREVQALYLRAALDGA